MSTVIIDTGNHIAGYAARAARVKVVAAYPITPQSPVVEQIAEFVEKGEMDAEYVRVESEHSAMATCIGAEMAGVRSFTATSAQGLALMHEMLHWASGARLPIVMAVVNRAMAAPWTIWSDFSDSLSQRDTGWLQFYCADNQEIFDTIIQAYRICEDKHVLLPAMVCFEGFILSHTSMPVRIPDQSVIDEFLPPYNPAWVIDLDNPTTHSALVSPDYYMEFRYMIQEAMKNAEQLIPQVDKEYAEKFGFSYGGHIECYECEDADLILLSMGTIGSEAKTAINNLRRQGLKVGSARLRVFRPFPKQEILKLGKNAHMMAVIDRQISFGMEGPLFTETKASLYESKSDPPVVASFIAGLGGRDVTYCDVERVALKCLKQLNSGKIEERVEWINLRM